MYGINHHLEMKQSNLEKLGINIKNKRKFVKISQEKLAEYISKSRNYIGMIERAEVNTPVGTLFEIANVLKCNIKEFFEDI